jgi:uncharacterized protein (TIGR02001 family)
MKSATKLLLATALATSTTMAAAEVTFSGNVAITSNYIFRGISQTDNAPAIQGGFDMEHSSGFYAGIWGSNVDSDFFSGAEAEFDLYAGFAGEYNMISYDIGYLAYRYPDSTFDPNDTEEIYGSLGYDFGPAAATLGVAYSSDFFGFDDGTYVYLDVDVPLPSDFAIGLHYGSSDYDDDSADYDDWKVGLSKSYAGFDFALDYTDTDISDGGPLADDKLVFTVSKSL